MTVVVRIEVSTTGFLDDHLANYYQESQIPTLFILENIALKSVP